MSAPPFTSDGPHATQTWQELEDGFATIGQLARSAVSTRDFYRTVLEQSVRALSAAGARAWFRANDNTMQLIVDAGQTSVGIPNNRDARKDHEALLHEAVRTGHVVAVELPAENDEPNHSADASGQLRLVGPVGALGDDADPDMKPARVNVIALIELWLCGDVSPGVQRGYEQYLAAVCDMAADFHAFHELRNLRQHERHRTELLELGPLVHRRLSLSATAYALANEGRRIVRCDRLSVLEARGRSCKLLAASGVSRIERRSTAARHLANIAEHVRRTDEPAYYTDGECDALPPVVEAITKHAETSHARHVAAIPVRMPTPAGEEHVDVMTKRSAPSPHERPQFVLVAEQFDSSAGELRRDWLVEVADVAATALYHARTFDRLPLGWLWRPLGRAQQLVERHVTRSTLLGLAMAGAIAAFWFVPADFHVAAPGVMQPSVRRDVFAPRSGIVDEVLVEHGANVSAGQALLRMRDPALELEFKRVDGELETAQRQLDAVRATKTNRAVRDASPLESYRLSAEERELEQKVANAQRELDLLKHERERLVVSSPIAGRVLTWDVGQQLLARPVERGEVLLTVADMSSPWRLELAVSDDRIGYVLAAQQEIAKDLPVQFRLSSDERAVYTGRIAEVCQVADVAEKDTTQPKPTVLTRVSLDSPELAATLGDQLRPGVSARAQIECGRRSLGYVWLHDIWDAVVEWWAF